MGNMRRDLVKLLADPKGADSEQRLQALEAFQNVAQVIVADFVNHGIE